MTSFRRKISRVVVVVDSGMELGIFRKIKNFKPCGDLCPWWVGREWKELEWEWRNVVILHRQKCNSC